MNTLNLEDNLIESNDIHNTFNFNKNYFLKSDICHSALNDINSLNPRKIKNNNPFSLKYIIIIFFGYLTSIILMKIYRKELIV